MNPLNWNPRSVVTNLLMLNALLFLAQTLYPNINIMLVSHLGLFPISSGYFYPHQLVTYMFLHGGFSHLFFNMFALWMFGSRVEYDLGAKRFLTYYMITGIGAGVLSLLVNVITGDPSGVTIGASGGVFGILLAYGMMHPNDRILLLIPPIPMKAKYFVIGYGLIELFSGFQANDNIAHFAHVGGMLFGIVLLLYWKKSGKIYF